MSNKKVDEKEVVVELAPEQEVLDVICDGLRNNVANYVDASPDYKKAVITVPKVGVIDVCAFSNGNITMAVNVGASAVDAKALNAFLKAVAKNAS